MFLSEWREFPSASCLAEEEEEKKRKKRRKKKDSSRLDVVDIVSVPQMLPSLFPSGRAKDLSAPR